MDTKIQKYAYFRVCNSISWIIWYAYVSVLYYPMILEGRRDRKMYSDYDITWLQSTAAGPALAGDSPSLTEGAEYHCMS